MRGQPRRRQKGRHRATSARQRPVSSLRNRELDAGYDHDPGILSKYPIRRLCGGNVGLACATAAARIAPQNSGLELFFPALEPGSGHRTVV